MNIYEAMPGYYQVFTKRIKSSPQEPPISRYCYPSDGQKNGDYYLLQECIPGIVCSFQEL